MNNSATRPCPRCAPGARVTSGFTLIELLVVIAIIAILASILFPVFSRARENARRASCQSNLKQITLGFMQYAQDYDERLPSVSDGSGGEKQIGWMYYTTFGTGTTPGTFDPAQGSIYPYIKNTQVFVCPSDSVDQADSYAINSCVAKTATFAATNAGVTGTLHAGNKLSYFQDTSSWMLLSEEAVTDQAADSTNDAYMSLHSGDKFSTRHFDGSDVAFIDGHVKWFKLNDLINKGFQDGGAPIAPGNDCPGS